MTTTRPELGFERLLAALGRDLLDAPEEEILEVANEFGQKPAMKGSLALVGVTFTFRLRDQHTQSTQHAEGNSTDEGAIGRSQRRPKGDPPSST